MRLSDLLSSQISSSSTKHLGDPILFNNRDDESKHASVQQQSPLEATVETRKLLNEKQQPEHKDKCCRRKTSSIDKFRSLSGNQLIEVGLKKDEKHGFGLALPGSGKRERTGTFVCGGGIHPNGPAAANERSLRSGDEILKVDTNYTTQCRKV
jgi:hypothetical protein